MPTLNIKDEEAYRLARRLADDNETSMTAEVLQALRERAARSHADKKPKAGLAERIIAFSKTTSPHFKGSDRTRDLFENLYDEDGLPRKEHTQTCQA